MGPWLPWDQAFSAGASEPDVWTPTLQMGLSKRETEDCESLPNLLRKNSQKQKQKQKQKNKEKNSLRVTN